MARPVVPLGRAGGYDFQTGSAHGARAGFLPARNRWAQALMLTVAIGAVVVALIALSGNNETEVSSNSPPTLNGAASVMGAERATETLIQTEMVDASDAPSNAPRVPDGRGSLPVRYEIRRDDAGEEERRGRDEAARYEDDDDNEKFARRARKEEKKRLERRRKEAEKLDERRRESEKGGESKPRLIGIYTEKP